MRGLSSAEAKALLKSYGTNEAVVERKVPAVWQLLSYFKSPLIVILLLAAVLSGVFGELRSAVIIILMALASVFLNFYQERKSGKEVEKLQERLSLTATVLRDGEKREIDIKTVVPGDTVLLSAGDIVPADGEVAASDDLFLNESSLTGESFPVEKIATDAGASPADANSVFAGTNVISGSGFVKIIATGRNTAYGKIAEKVQAKPEEDAFERGIRGFGFLIVRATVFIVLSVFLVNTFKPLILGQTLTHGVFMESFLFAIAIAVGLTPELLPVIMSVNMAKGSTRMAKKGVLVKRLNAIPDFGSIDILCTDKTGTLTEGRIVLVKYLDVAGQSSEHVLRYAYLNSAFQTGLKNPLDQAVLAFKHLNTGESKKIDEIPYDFQRKRLSIVISAGKSRELVTKGQPEEVVKVCSHYAMSGKIHRFGENGQKLFRKVYENYSKQGFKMLAVAVREVESDREKYAVSEEKDMTLLGFIGFFDPPKATAADTLVRLGNYGVEVKIITGDNELVAEKVCRDLRLPIKGIMVGEQLASLSDEALAVKAEKVTIFARFSPAQKNRVINALRSDNKVVGYLGDGINDAPSLKAADVGISVDNAVDVARETADIILTHKSLHVLIEGIIEGRKTFGNTMKYLMMGVSSNFGNMFSLIFAAFYLPFLPMRPIQVLFNNTLYDISQITIPSDQVDPEYLKKPKHWNMQFIKKFMVVFGSISSVFDLLTFFLLYGIFHLSPGAFQTGWFIESLATQTFVIYIIRTKRFFLRSRPSYYLLATTLSAVTVGVVLTFSPWGGYFAFQALPARILLLIAGLVVVYLVIVEAAKHWFYKHHDL